MPRPTPQEAMRDFLSGEGRSFACVRRLFRRVPSSPRCKLCTAPFEGPGGAVLRHVGFARYPGNPAICGNCIKSLNKVGTFGAEISVSLLFADIRGSTTIGESMTPTEFRAYLDHFYRITSEAILGNDGIVDKFVGDEAIGLFFRGISGTEHSAAAIRAARHSSTGWVGPMQQTTGRFPSARRSIPVMRSSGRRELRERSTTSQHWATL